MIELAEFALTFWKQSKKDWQKNKHRIFAFFGFVLVAFFVLEFGSYIFTKRLNQAKSIDLIRSKFMDKRASLADEASRKMYGLKGQTRILLKSFALQKNDVAQCERLLKQYHIEEIEADMFTSLANLRYFFGDEVTREFLAFNEWYDDNEDDCFLRVKDAEKVMDDKVISIRNKMWRRMYPPEVIKGIT
jgi:hypothetical protein